MIDIYDFKRVTGTTHKRIGVDEIVDDALKNQIDTISVISSGNQVNAIREEIHKKGLDDIINVVNLVNSTSRSHSDQLLITNNQILRDATEREKYVNKHLPNSGKVKDYTDFIPKKYADIADRMLRSNPNGVPDVIVLPVGTGKLFLSLADDIEKNGYHTKLIGIVPKGENGIYVDNRLYEKNGDTFMRKYKDESIADKLNTPYTFFRDRILATKKNGHSIHEATNKDFIRANKIALEYGVKGEYSGTAGFIVTDPHYVKNKTDLDIDLSDHIMVVNTGEGSVKKSMQVHQFMHVRKKSLVQKAWKPLATAAVVTILMNFTMNKIQDYQNIQGIHKVYVKIAADLSKKGGPKLYFNLMSNNELLDYFDFAKNWMGGPAHYW